MHLGSFWIAMNLHNTASGWHEIFYQLVRIIIFAIFLYIACVYNEIFTCPNGIFTHLGRVDVYFSTSDSMWHFPYWGLDLLLHLCTLLQIPQECVYYCHIFSISSYKKLSWNMNSLMKLFAASFRGFVTLMTTLVLFWWVSARKT